MTIFHHSDRAGCTMQILNEDCGEEAVTGRLRTDQKVLSAVTLIRLQWTDETQGLQA